MTEQVPTEVRWIRYGGSNLITSDPIAGSDLTIERSDSGVMGRGYAVYARSVDRPVNVQGIGWRKLQRDAKALAEAWIAARKAEAAGLQDWTETPQAALLFLRVMDGMPNAEHEAYFASSAPIEVDPGPLNREPGIAEILDRHVVTAPIADARAVTAALESSDAVTILIPSQVDRTLREIAERNDVPVALVRDLYAEQIAGSPVADLIDESDPISIEAATTGHLRKTPGGECWSSCPHPSHNDPETGQTYRLPPA